MMTNATAREFSIATPTGQRVLVAIRRIPDEPTDYASVRDGFEPHSDDTSRRLRLRDWRPNTITASPDGIWINHRQLYAIANSFVAKLRTPVLADTIRDVLFFDGYRPDVSNVFRSVFATYDDRDRWWIEMNRTSSFDFTAAMLRPTNPRF